MRTYEVTSHTTREKESHPELCWMEIRVSKLKEAKDKRADYIFIYSVEDDEFKYKYSASKLLEIFEKHQVRTNKPKKGEAKYSFFLDYGAGALYHTLHGAREKDNLIVKLDPIDRKKGSDKGIKDFTKVNGEDILNQVLEQVEDKLVLLKIIAQTAYFAPVELHKKCMEKGCPAKYPWIRRKKSYENRGWNAEKQEKAAEELKKKVKEWRQAKEWSDEVRKGKAELYFDDNSYPNSQMKAAFPNLLIEAYETCHIWDESCYDPRYHTCYANLVLLPRAIASLSDHSTLVKKVLQWKAFERFGWKPDEAEKPVPSAGYENLPWRE